MTDSASLDLKSSRSRSGIALIIVLGFLSVMMILGVSFALSMRTERTVAAHQMEIVKGRQLLYAALARAMRDIEQDLQRWDSEAYPVFWSTRDTLGFGNAVGLHRGGATNLLPRGLMARCGKLGSPGMLGFKDPADRRLVMDSNAWWASSALALEGAHVEGLDKYGHRVIGLVTNNDENSFGAVYTGMGQGTNLSGNIEWMGGWYRVVDPALPQWTPVPGGKIAYLIVNVSGLLDANHVGGLGVSRQFGTNVQEIRITSELSDIDNAASFLNSRDSWVQTYGAYETMFELMTENTGWSAGGPTNFFNYSRYPVAMATNRYGDPFPMVDLSGDAYALETRADEIVDAFTMALKEGAHPAESGQDWRRAATYLYTNLLDYVDEDNVPRSLEGPYVDKSPMINEIQVRANIVVDSHTNVLPSSTIMVFVEYCFAFEGGPDATYQASNTIRVVDSSNLGAPALPVSVTKSLPGNMFVGPYPDFKLAPPHTNEILKLSGPGKVEDGAVQVECQVLVEAGLLVDGDGRYVDYVPSGLPIRISTNIVPPSIGTKTVSIVSGKDVIDPVFNWMPTHWNIAGHPHFPYEPSLNAVNHSTLRYYAANSNRCDDFAEPWYVANRPLVSVGELGRLYSPGPQPALAWPYNAGVDMQAGPRLWRTAWLYDRNTNSWERVLDYFTLRSTNNGVWRGLVNPNSEVEEALAAVFHDMPTHATPGNSGQRLSSWEDAKGLAGAIGGAARTGGPLERLSDLGRRDVAQAVFAELGWSHSSEMQKEAFFRNAAGLLHTRQNLFVILLAGRTADDPYTYGDPAAGGDYKSDQRALAVVWRDPVPDANGRHPSFVRWFTWLEK